MAYRLEVETTVGVKLSPAGEYPDKGAAEEQADIMSRGFDSRIAFWDVDGDYVSVNGQYVLAVVAKEV